MAKNAWTLHTTATGPTRQGYYTTALSARLSLDGILAPDPTKMVHVFNMTHKIHRDQITYRQLMQLMDVWIWFVLLKGPFLSILFDIYPFLNRRDASRVEEIDDLGSGCGA